MTTKKFVKIVKRSSVTKEQKSFLFFLLFNILSWSIYIYALINNDHILLIISFIFLVSYLILHFIIWFFVNKQTYYEERK